MKTRFAPVLSFTSVLLLAACAQIVGLGDSPGSSIDEPGEAGADDARSTADALPAPKDGQDAVDASGWTLTVATKRIRIVRGAVAKIPVRVDRRGGVGSLEIRVSGLPPGVTADASVLEPNESAAEVTLHATPEAPLGVDGSATFDASAGGASLPSTNVPLIVQDASGTLDTTFGAGGVARIPIPGVTEAGIGPHGVVVQRDGRIVYCGGVTTQGAYELVVGRVTIDGNVDTTFVDNGVFTGIKAGYSAEICRSLALVPSGGIALAGFSWTPGQRHTMFAVKLTNDGAFDDTFGVGGFVAVPAAGLDSNAYDLGVGPDDRWILGGFLQSSAALARLSPNGTPDETFAASSGSDAGAPVAAYSSVLGPVNAITVLRDGRSLAVVDAHPGIVMRVTPSGILDPTFGSNGATALTAPGIDLTAPNGVATLSDGTAVAIGYDDQRILLGKVRGDGTLETSFGTGGIASYAVAGIQITSLVASEDDALIAGGVLPSAQYAVYRFNSDGKIDLTFNRAGYAVLVATSGATILNQAAAVAVDPYGRIVLATMETKSGTAATRIARFWP